MAGFKNTYLITFTGKTDRTHYHDLEIEISTPYDWQKMQDIPLLFELIKMNIQKDFEKYDLLRIEKID